MDVDDRYGQDVLAGNWRTRRTPPVPEVSAEHGLVVEAAEGGWTGAIVSLEHGTLGLEDWKGRVRYFPITAPFLIEGTLVKLVPPKRPGHPAHSRTASGSFAVTNARARVARDARILVEGRHDAELVERVWGDDLRVEGVVVEELDGVDNLITTLAHLKPGPGRRVGVLVDHLIPGSKESRIADEVERSRHGAHTLVLGHPYVDVWQAVSPRALGIRAWPEVPRGIEWKHGICEAFGWPHDDQADIARAWQRILSAVHSYKDLEPSLIGRVEELIDFVTADE